MRVLLLTAALVLGLAACSSNEKKDATMSKETVKAAETKATETKDEAAAKGSDMAGMASKAACTLGKDTRVIEVKKMESGGCELFYTKFGEAKSVASSGFGTQYCEEVKDRIQSNLVKAGFDCK